MVLLVLVRSRRGLASARDCRAASCPIEDQGYLYLNVQLPAAASLQRTDEVCRKIEAILKATPGVQYCTTVVGLQPAEHA